MIKRCLDCGHDKVVKAIWKKNKHGDLVYPCYVCKTGCFK